MSTLTKRVVVLEDATLADQGRCHRITRDPDMSEADAIDGYGRYRIGPNDRIIMRTIVTPPTVEIVS